MYLVLVGSESGRNLLCTGWETLAQDCALSNVYSLFSSLFDLKKATSELVFWPMQD